MTACTGRLDWLGDSALRLELPAGDDLSNARRMRRMCHRLDEMKAAGELPGLQETIPALRTITLLFDPRVADPFSWQRTLLDLAGQPMEPENAGRLREVPVCFDEDFAPDLDDLAARAKTDREAFITAFLDSPVEVLMLGFLPGFAYLGSLPDCCQAPRLPTPRANVPAGSVAIAGHQCAIYPWDSPGGWNLIGRSPVQLFDKSAAAEPVWLLPGDLIQWRRIDRVAFLSWRS